MLATKGYTKDQIATFKLVNGDEIVAKIVEETDKSFQLSKPCSVVPTQQGISLMQTLFTADLNKVVPLDKAHVILHAPTVKEMEAYYIKMTTGIETVPAGGIIT